MSHESADGWTRATAWTFGGRRWRRSIVLDAAHIWVRPRNNYARVESCFSYDTALCDDDEILEDWTWDGAKVKREAAQN